MISAPGYYDLSMSDYLSDPCPEPSLSSKIVHTLFKSTPQKAMRMHPRLSGQAVDMTPRADIGSAVHAIAHGGAPVRYVEKVALRSGKRAGEVFEPTDWATQDAKDARDAIRAEGGIPLLPKDRLGVETAAGNIRYALALLGPGKFEGSMCWQRNGVWARGRYDWLSEGAVVVPELNIDAPNGVDVDTKTVDNADAESWIKSTLYGNGLDCQVGLRHLGHEALGKPRLMLWLLQEYEPPYDTCFVGASEQVIALAVRKVNHAEKIWRRCLDAKSWPANDKRVRYAAAPPWVEWEMESRGVL